MTTRRNDGEKYPWILGLTGLARCGKDTFCGYAMERLRHLEIKSQRLAFADELKKDVDGFLKKKLGISAFTENNEEKELIRPMLTCWGTDIMRKKDDLHWVKKVVETVEKNKENGIVSIVTDVRFPNEIDYIQKMGGEVIHLTLTGTEPANDYERENDPLLKENADILVEWKRYGPDELHKCVKHVKKALDKLF